MSSRGLECDGQNKDQFRVNFKPAMVDGDIFSTFPGRFLEALRWKLILAFSIGTRDAAQRTERYASHYLTPQCSYIKLSELMKELSVIHAFSSTEDI